MEKKKTNSVMALFLVFLMVGSIAGILVGGFTGTSANQFNYNGFTFTQTQHGITTDIDGREVLFVFDPQTLESLEIPSDLSEFQSVSKVYLSADPRDQMIQAFAEFNRFRSVYGISASATPACPVDSDTCELNNYPVRDCSDASEDTGVIVLLESNNSKSTFENNCLTIEGTLIDAAQYFNKVGFQRFGIL